MATTTTDDERVGPTTIGQRLGACRDAIEELEEQLRDERRRRNELVVQARDDEGMSHRQIGHYSGLTKSRVIAILAAN